MGKNITDNTSYFYEIAFEFLSRIKRGYFLSPLEIDLIKKWESNNIPLKIIKKSLYSGFRKPGRKKTLLYFKKIVEKEFKKEKEKLTPKNDKIEENNNENIQEQIEIINSDYFKKRYKEFAEGLPLSEKEKEEFDKSIDKKIIEFYYDEEEIKNEWNQKFQYIKIGETEKKRLMKKYFIMKKREEFHLFYFSYI